MRFLADENFPRSAVVALRKAGLEVVWVSEESPGSADEDILTRCASAGLTLLTFDKDFGELVFRRGLSAEGGVILFRVDATSPTEFAKIALTAVRSRTDWSQFFTVVSRDRIRMTPLKR